MVSLSLCWIQVCLSWFNEIGFNEDGQLARERTPVGNWMRNSAWLAAVRIGVGSSLLIAALARAGGVGAQSSATNILTVESSDPVSGAVIGITPADAKGAGKGTTKFTRTYDSGSSVTLTAPAKAGGNVFVAWTGCKTAITVTCKVVMSADKTVIAKYSPAYVLTVASSGPASGIAIGVSPADRNGASKGATKFTRSYLSGTAVTLTAPAKSGAAVFVGWSGCKNSSSVSCKVLLAAKTTAPAKYAPADGLTVDSSNPESGVAVGVSPADRNGKTAGTTKFTRTYLSGADVTHTATPKNMHLEYVGR